MVKFCADKQCLAYINLEGPGQEVAIMLLQRVQDEQGTEAGRCIETAMVQRVQGNYKGYTKNKKDILKAKEACKAQAIIGNPSKKDYKGMVSGNLITNRPVTTTNISNTRPIFDPDH